MLYRNLYILYIDFSWAYTIFLQNYSDVKQDRIGRMDLRHEGQLTYIVDSGLDNADGLAVDWISRNLYWTDNKGYGMSEIAVSKLDGRFRRTLIRDGIGKPRAIAVHPTRG